MNIVTSAVTEICNYRIPIEILQIVFLQPQSAYSGAPTTVEDSMVNKVIKPRVLRDVDITGGQIIPVDTSGLPIELADFRTMVIEIPPERVNNRMILSAMSASYLPETSNLFTGLPAMNFNGLATNSDMVMAGHRVMASYGSAPIVSTAQIELISNNTVMIREQTRISGIYTINLLVGNEENLSNLPIKVFPAFTKMCELAIKSYIYTYMRVKADRQYLINGQPLGSIKEIIDEYRDAEEMYQAFVKEQWGATARLADTSRKNKFYKLQIPAGL